MTGRREVDGVDYFFDSDGVMQANRWIEQDGGSFYVQSSGAIATNTWLHLGSKWFYVDANGIRAVGLVKVGAEWYHFSDDEIGRAHV